MKISPINTQIQNKINFYGIREKKIISCAFSLPKDIFVKSTKKTEENRFNLEHIKSLYNTVLNDSLKINFYTNPITKDLNLENPQLIIANSSNVFGVAAYNFPSNTISINEKIVNSDLYLLYSEDKKAGNNNTYGIFPEDELKQEITSCKSLNIKAKTLKLNEKEKEFYIAASLAHEIRHFLQAHLMASTEEISPLYIKEQIDATDKYNALIPSYNENLKQIEETVENCRKNGIKVIPALIEILNTQKPKNYVDTTYAKNYKPTSLLERNTPFKFSMLPYDYRTITPLDFYNASFEKANNNEDNKSYYANLLEIDAYNHGLEYVFVTKKKYEASAREIVLDSIAQNAQRSSLLGISYAKEENKLPKTMYE